MKITEKLRIFVDNEYLRTVLDLGKMGILGFRTPLEKREVFKRKVNDYTYLSKLMVRQTELLTYKQYPELAQSIELTLARGARFKYVQSLVTILLYDLVFLHNQGDNAKNLDKEGILEEWKSYKFNKA